MGIDISNAISDNKDNRHKEKTGKENIFNKDFSFKKNKLTDKRKEAFYAELGILLSSGVNIKAAIEIIIEEQKQAFTKEVYKKILLNIVSGSGLSEALSKSKYFSIYEINTVKIGEESSKLIEVLKNLSDYFGKKIKQKRQLINAFSYPIIIVITAFAAIYFMLNFMVPMFQGVFERFNSNLPGLTQGIINLSHFFSKYFYLFILLIAAIIIAVFYSRSKNWFRSGSANLILITPYLKKIVKLIYLERFFQAMALLSGAKIPLIRSIKLVKGMVNFYPFEKAMDIAEKDVMFGQLLHESLSKFSLFDKKIISLIKVGEETNQLQFIFEKLYSQHAEELDFQISLISSILEPFIIIFIGLLVGVILVAMYLPMFQMSTTIM